MSTEKKKPAAERWELSMTVKDRLITAFVIGLIMVWTAGAVFLGWALHECCR